MFTSYSSYANAATVVCLHTAATVKHGLPCWKRAWSPGQCTLRSISNSCKTPRIKRLWIGYHPRRGTEPLPIVILQTRAPSPRHRSHLRQPPKLSSTHPCSDFAR
ncbi:unnamed protein product [Chondrus crispus]|uniref:Uncharacterized protein n=1 Tax=Chondrus crispus TaxID=2769 RepID=R7Q7W4_CHOCR|nr:unnamed protein product [Chondrus crispus]CDF34637.1 unnamed protein product [Chondrus crispus]|eukprot:XP_005714456.1 unnamed protein product [Chondrus crispus]